jgi:hypothetical protein
MSRQSKNTRNRSIAKQFSEQRKNGGSGPAKTTPQHGKRWGYRDNPARLKDQGAVSTKPQRTSGRRILDNAGAAAA